MRDWTRIGIIFDVDGVLVDSAEPHAQSWFELARENHATVTREQFLATFGRQNRDIIPLLFGPVSEEELIRLSNRKEEIYRAFIRGRVPVARGARELVSSLAQRGARLAVASSGPRENIELVLREMGATDFFPAIVTAEDVSRGKPDPQVFELAINRLGLPAGSCVVIEDAPAGVEAARRAGARCVAIAAGRGPRSFEVGSARADLVVDQLRDMTCDRIGALMDAW